MKIYILIDSQDTDCNLGTNVIPFVKQEDARTALRQAWEKAIEDWTFDTSKPQTDEYYSECQKDTAVIRNGDEEEQWRIEEHEVSVNAAVEVSGGLVANVYANADIGVDVYDLDISEFPDEGEAEAADAKEQELQALIQMPEWRKVW